MKRHTLCLLVLAMASACTSEEEKTEPYALQLKTNATHGEILTDKDGKALYYFSDDTKGTSNCSGPCLAAWPAFTLNGEIDPKITSSEVGEITRADGAKQATYKGWPLYYFADDMEQVKGDGVNKVWYVAKTDYLLMVARAQLIGADEKSYKADYTEGTANTLYLTDDKGRTLYGFVNDKNGKNNFTKEDFSNDSVWPIFQKMEGSYPSLVNKADFKVIDVFGKKQLSYKGWPLYYFGQDEKRGDNKGISFPRPGVWPIVNADTQPAP
jgi:predicted lipoprotein with Yx(FWY)xxD motif